MPEIAIKRSALPFLLGGAGQFSVNTGKLQPNRPVPETTESILSVAFDGEGAESTTLGQGGTVKVAVSAKANVRLTPVFASSKPAAAALLKTYGIAPFFRAGANSDKVVLVFETGATAGAGVTGTFSYAPLKAGATLEASADVAYAYARAVDRKLPLQKLLVDYFATMRLPEQALAKAGRAIEPGEAISLQYGGSLNLGAEASAGYELTGTKSAALGGLKLSEKYNLSVIGRVGLKARVAGRFSILITADAELPGWTRIQVRRHRAKDFSVLADVNVGFKNQLDVPATADEFLGAVLGVNAKSFLTVFQKARDLSDFDALKSEIDGLARRFVGEYIGKDFEKLASQAELTKFLADVNKVVTSYETVGDRAVTLFDRYFDRIDVLTDFLDRLTTLHATGLEALRKELNNETWTILSQLTDGDPLSFLLRQVQVDGQKVDSVDELGKRATAALELVRSAAHKEIRDLVALARTSFGVDPLFRELAKVDTFEELEGLANEKLGEFITRLLGRTLDSATNIKLALAEIRAVLDSIDGFKNKLFDTFKSAANSSYKMSLHAQYSRASERDSLIDVVINPSHAGGPELLELAGRGDFEKALTTSDTDLVRLREGLFTHRTKRERAFSVNIVGWHLNYNYAGFDRVITEAEQRLVPSEAGEGITVYTDMSLSVARQRKRRQEEMHVSFLLRALGESAKVVRTSGANTAFLVDTLKSLTASYQLAFTDDQTSLRELDDYLAFAAELGLDEQGATAQELLLELPRTPGGGFGRIKASYDVRFGSRALEALLSIKQISKAAEATIRTAMRRITLAGYLKSGDQLHDVAFAYATPATFDRFRVEGPAAFGSGTLHRVFPVHVDGIAAPTAVSLDKQERNLLVALYGIEQSMVNAIKSLIKVLGGGTKMDPEAFEKRMGDFGRALSAFDEFDQTTSNHAVGASTAFMVFDALVRLASPDKPANIAVLKLESDVDGRSVEKLFMSDEAAEG